MVGPAQSAGKPGDLICLCIGGRLFVTRRATLYRLPDSRLYLIATQGSSNQNPTSNYNAHTLSDLQSRYENDSLGVSSNLLSPQLVPGRLTGNGPSEGTTIGGATILPDNIASMLAGNMNLQSASSLCRNRGSSYGISASSLAQTPGVDLCRSLNPSIPVTPSTTSQYPFAATPFIAPPPIVYFYDRDPEIFRFVLDYYRTGELHLPSSICGPFVRKELIFWGIDEALIGPCCMPAYMRYDEEKRTKNTLFRDCFEDIDSMQNLVKYSRGWKKWRYRMWLFMDHPTSSLAAKIWASCLLVLMIASVMCYCLSTHEVFRMRSSVLHLNTSFDFLNLPTNVMTISNEFTPLDTNNYELYYNRLNAKPSFNSLTHGQKQIQQQPQLSQQQTSLRSLSNMHLQTHSSTNQQHLNNGDINSNFTGPLSICYDSLWHPNPKIQKDCSTEPTEGLVIFDITLNCLFTFEFLLKVLLAPDKPKFLSSIVSIFDMTILTSYWIYISLFYYYYYNPKTLLTTDQELRSELSGYLWLLNMLSMTQALRILRVFKISKISRGLRVLILTVKKSIPELVLLGFLLMNGMFLFSSMMYIAEYRVNDTFPDIPQSFWWSIITLTAVGYGDMHPKGGAGYFVGSLTAISGCIVTGLAIPIIGNNFNTYYKYMKNQLMEDKYLKALRKDMEATGSGSKSGIGAAAEKGGLPLPGRKPRNVNRKTVRGKIPQPARVRTSLMNFVEDLIRPLRRLLPMNTTSTRKPTNVTTKIGISKSTPTTSDSMQLLTENQQQQQKSQLSSAFINQVTNIESSERKHSILNQSKINLNNKKNNIIGNNTNNSSINQMINNYTACTNSTTISATTTGNIKINGEKLDFEHRPSLMYPLATDQLLNSLLPSQLSLISAPQIWVDGEELDDQLFNNNNNNNNHTATNAFNSTNDMSRLYSRMSIVSEELLPNSIIHNHNMQSNTFNLCSFNLGGEQDIQCHDTDLTSGEESLTESLQTNSKKLSKNELNQNIKFKLNNKINPQSISSLTNNDEQSLQPIQKRMNYV